MPDYSVEQLYGSLIRAGFNPDVARTMTAVSLAENTERSLQAQFHTPIEDSYGPFQINLKAHPQYSIAQVTNLDGAAKAAKEIYDRSGGASPWSQFINGSYIGFLQTVDAAIPNFWSGAINNSFGQGSALPNLNPIPSVTDGIKDALGPLINVLVTPINLLVKILTYLTTEKHWWQIGFVLAGLGLIGLGSAVFFKDSIEPIAKKAIAAGAV